MITNIPTLADSTCLTDYLAAGGRDSATNFSIVEKLVRREVLYCVSSLVATIAQVAGEQGRFGDTDYDEVLDLCGGSGPDETEVFEHWIVTQWAERKLTEHGERVGDLEGMTVWGRDTTGQAIALDTVWHEIAAEMQILQGQAYDWSRSPQ